MTKRQREYREYLASEHWAGLRKAALDRDNGVCVRCGGKDWLQVHHRVYRGNWEDGEIGDVETLCRRCHRLEHGIGPCEVEMMARELSLECRHQRRPLVEKWRAFKLAGGTQPIWSEVFGDLMFEYVSYVWAHEREGSVASWWMDKAKADFWFERSHRIREGIKARYQDGKWWEDAEWWMEDVNKERNEHYVGQAL